MAVALDDRAGTQDKGPHGDISLGAISRQAGCRQNGRTGAQSTYVHSVR